MKNKYSKLRKLLRESTISTHPGEIFIQIADPDDRYTLFELLMEVAEEGDDGEKPE